MPCHLSFLQKFTFQASLKLLNNQVDKISEIGIELTIRLLIFVREDFNNTNSRCAFINQSTSKMELFVKVING